VAGWNRAAGKSNKKASPLREKLFGGGAAGVCLASSDFADVHGVNTLAAFLCFEFYPVILLYRSPVQTRYVNEKVLLGFVVGYEAIAFGFVEKFDNAGFHAKN
jgi:hypothetical protein